MAKAYYSNLFPQSADHIWNVIRDFNNYPVCVDGAGDSYIEAGKSGDAAGAVCTVMYQGKNIRQKLLPYPISAARRATNSVANLRCRSSTIARA